MKQNQSNQNVDFRSSTPVDFVPDAKPELSKYGHVLKVIFYAKKVTMAPLTIIAYFIQVNESANAVYLIINKKCLNCLNNQIP